MVVSDTTPITTLLKARQADLLQKLFGSVTIPEAVFEELRAFHAAVPDFIRVQAIVGPGRRLPGTENLGRGEAEAVRLAKEAGAEILLTDDRKARGRSGQSRYQMCGPVGLAHTSEEEEPYCIGTNNDRSA
jgi:predicted nucleic acid-binding protein